MREKASPAEIRRIRQLMRGSPGDKDRAERQLKQYDPWELPADILDVWTQGSPGDKDRAGRVQSAWRKRRRRGI